jgi:NodT family efflux transporter outer membrane factor (OMF) lipoprotein
MFSGANILKLSIFSAMLLFFVQSCSILKPDRYPDISPSEDLYREAGSYDSTNIADVRWRDFFTDPHLQNIIEIAIENSPDLQIAEARMKRAEAAFRQSRAELFPSLNAGFNAIFQNSASSFTNPNAGSGIPEIYRVYANTSWEADIWGKFSHAKRAELASLYASEAYRRAVLTQLISRIAMDYYSLLALDAQLSITEETVDARIRNAETMKVLKENDVVTGADLVLSEANRYSAEVTIPDLKQRIYETENSISILTGRSPGPVERGTLDEQQLYPGLGRGVPAQLLANRPDVQEAEYQLRSSFELTKAARAYFYPAVTINAAGGLTEIALSALFSSPGTFWNITAGLAQPIFNYGLNRQRFSTAKANQEESLANFRRVLLDAGSEVSNAMHAWQSANDKISLRAAQIENLEKAVDFTMELLKYTSTTNYIDVLTSEVNLLSARLNDVNDRLQQLQALTDLYRSLGGGWK